MALQENLSNLQVLMDAMREDHLGKKDFLDAFQRVLEIILRKEKQMSEAIQRLEETYKTLLDRMTSEHSSSLSDLKKGVNELFVKGRLDEMDAGMKAQMTEMQQMMNDMMDGKMKEVDSRVAQLKDGKRGLMGPPGPPGTWPKEAEKRLDSLEEKIGKIVEAVRKAAGNTSGRMGVRKIPMLRVVDLTASVNGSATTFTLPRDTVRVHMAWATQFPIILRPDVDFTFAGQTLTITSQVGTLQSGQTLTCLIETLFYA